MSTVLVFALVLMGGGTGAYLHGDIMYHTYTKMIPNYDYEINGSRKVDSIVPIEGYEAQVVRAKQEMRLGGILVCLGVVFALVSIVLI